MKKGPYELLTCFFRKKKNILFSFMCFIFKPHVMRCSTSLLSLLRADGLFFLKFFLKKDSNVPVIVDL